jgi:D-aminoacyl-tRNA deacylase
MMIACAAVRAVVQRVKEASVRVEGEVVGRIGRGLVVLLGVGRGDEEADADYLALKTAHLRVFPDSAGRMDRSAVDAAPPERAALLYERYVQGLRAHGLRVETGVFRAMMDVALVNEGPVTLLLDSGKAS